MAIVSNGKTATQAKPSVEDLVATIASLQAQLASKNTLKLKVSEKGALSVYGLQRFPITL